ncbi:MAG: carboxypeptidase-like regulatory domain-containing protein [Pyrinomonadaceae bacterium]
MKYSAKREDNYTLLTLTGLFVLIFSTLISLQAQTSIIKDSEREQVSPSVVLVPDGFAVVASTGDGTAATVRVVDITQFGTLWNTISNYSPAFIATTAQMPLHQTWSTALFQNQVLHGLAVSHDGTTIYASTHAYTGVNRTPNIYRITSLAPTPATLMATLPGGGNYGVGGIDLDETHNLLFASNMDDGKIYRIDVSSTPGTILDSFDPLLPDTSGTNLPPMGERIISVAYHRLENRLYYSVWGTSANTVRSIGLDSSGAFNPPSDDTLEFTIPSSQTPAGDIEFNVVGNRMLIAEEPLFSSPTSIGLSAHNGRILEYVRGITGIWTPDPAGYGSSPIKYEAGMAISRTNSRGGITFVYSAPIGNTGNGNERFVLFTGDALRLDSAAVYGLQFTPSSGGSAGGGSLPSNSLIADLDYDTSAQDKTVYGDVDMRKIVAPTSGEVSIGGRIIDASGNGLGRINVTITQQSGATASAITNPFGYYRFENVPVEQIVIVDVASKHYTFNPSSQAILAEEDRDNVNFTAEN